jgi:hypothetical protein
MTVQANPSKDELCLYMRVPVWYQRRWLLQISDYVRDVLGLRNGVPGSDHMPERGRFAYCFDNRSNNVPMPPSRGQPAAGEWVWRLVASCRAPLITCETRLLKLLPDQNTDSPDLVFQVTEDPPRAQAVDWTLLVAREFDLRYVEAKALREWPISYDEVDPAFEDALEYIPNDEPNAFQVLFLEV